MTKIEKINAKIFKLYEQIEELQANCTHTNTSKKGFSDTGNWCKADDCYWWEFRCPDCGKIWTEDQ